MKFEIRVPISPREDFFRRVEFLQRSVRACGGLTAAARLVVSIGDDIEPFDVAAREPWSRDEVVWRWVDREAFRRGIFTGLHRFSPGRTTSCIRGRRCDLRRRHRVLLACCISPQCRRVAHAPREPIGDVFQKRDTPPWDAYQHSGWRLMCHERATVPPAY
jgi:hypothetical protein